MSEQEFSDISKEINALLGKVNQSLKKFESIKENTLMFQMDIEYPSTLTKPLYPLSISETSSDINALKKKIHSALEIGDLMHALALQSQLIANLYLSDSSFNMITISAISDLAELYYSKTLYDQAGIHSSTILKHISKIDQNDQEVYEIKTKAMLMLARAKMSQKMYKKAHELLNAGMKIMKKHDIYSLQSLYLGIKGLLCELQGFDLSAIEAYVELIDKKLYVDDKDHIEILMKLYHISKKTGEDDKALEYLQDADTCYNSAIDKDMSIFLNEFSKDQAIVAVEIAEKTLNGLADQNLCIDQRKKELGIRHQLIQTLMGLKRYDNALKEQNNLLDIISNNWGADSIKFNLNLINKAVILKNLEKPEQFISLIRKTITNKRFRDHLKINVFSKKLKSILNDIDTQLKERLIAEYMDLREFVAVSVISHI